MVSCGEEITPLVVLCGWVGGLWSRVTVDSCMVSYGVKIKPLAVLCGRVGVLWSRNTVECCMVSCGEEIRPLGVLCGRDGGLQVGRGDRAGIVERGQNKSFLDHHVLKLSILLLLSVKSNTSNQFVFNQCVKCF